MDFTRKETDVVRCLRRHRVAGMKKLREELDLSHMTVVRALKKFGYHSSINKNASYYTLADIPQFDEDGLWTYRDICFSKHGNLRKTLIALAQKSAAGLSVAEFEERVKTKAGNLLSRLCGENELSRYFVGHKAFYLSMESKRQEQQRRERERLRVEATRAKAETEVSPFPPKTDVVTVLEVLMQFIKTPKADAAQIAKSLRARGVSVTVVQVRRIFDFYELEKKTPRSPSRTSRLI